jgi:hypothetical protein
MTLQSKTPPELGSRGGAGSSLPVSRSNPKTSPGLQAVQARFRHLARRIHVLGPAALSYFLADLAAGKPFLATLEDYAALEPLADLVAAYATEPRPFCLAGGRR